MRHSHQKVVLGQCWPVQFQTASFQLPGSRGSKFRWPIASGSGFGSNTECGIKMFLVCLKQVSMYAFLCSLRGSWTFKVAGLQLFHNVPCRLLRLAPPVCGIFGSPYWPQKDMVGQEVNTCPQVVRKHIRVCSTTELGSSRTGRKPAPRPATLVATAPPGPSSAPVQEPGRDWALKASFIGRILVPPVFVLHMRTWKSASATTHFCDGRPFFCCLFYTLWTFCVLRIWGLCNTIK